MTVVAPVEWKRQDMDSHDQYGRVLATYGSCTSSNSKTKWFLLTLFLLNFLAVLLSNVQIFLARNLPQQLNETKEVAFSMLMLLEACLVGAPVLIVVRDSPTARFLVSISLVVVVCMAILVPQIPNKVQRQRHISIRSGFSQSRGGPSRESSLRSMGSMRGSVNSMKASVRHYIQPQIPPMEDEKSASSFG